MLTMVQEETDAYVIGISNDVPYITHKVCGKTSYNPNDVREKYCGYCHVFIEDQARDTARYARFRQNLESLESLAARVAGYDYNPRASFQERTSGTHRPVGKRLLWREDSQKYR